MDTVSAANASLSRELAAAAKPRATCRDCGSRGVAWVQSKRTQRWYLADALDARGLPGMCVPQPARPHFKTCGDEQLHPQHLRISADR